MFILKNAVKNICRYKNKYIMFGILYLILILAASICANVFIQMGKVTDNILKEYAGVSRLEQFILQEDMFDVADRVSKNEYLELKDIEHIDDVKFLKYNFYSDFLKENVSELEVTAGDTVVHAPVFVLGYNMTLMYLVPEDFDLESGRMFENDGECVISKNAKAADEDSLAWNATELGDKITIENNDGIYKQFTVVGIQKQNDDDIPETNRRMVYTTLESAEYFDAAALVKNAGLWNYALNPEKVIDNMINNTNDIASNNSIQMGYEALIYLDSTETFLTLSSQLFNIKRFGFYFSLVPFFPDFRPLVNMTKNLKETATGFTVITAFIIICVSIVTTIILINSRKYEIAVLRSVGMKKSRLILNYLIENLNFIWSITAISLIAAQFIGPMFTNRVFENMQSMVSTEIFNTLTRNANIELLLQNAGFVFGGMTVIMVLSLTVACINIIRFEPMKIFNKQY